MTDFVNVARLDQLPCGTSKAVRVGEIDVALFNVDGTVYAIADSCAHAGASLALGKLEGKVVTCCGHGWQYDVSTGQTSCIPGLGVDSYEVRIVAGCIRVAIS